MKKCSYGCNKEALFEISGKGSCSKSSNQCEAVRERNSKGLILAHAKGVMKSGFTDENRITSRITFIKNLKERPFETWGYKLIRVTVLEEQRGKCLNCDIGTTWNELPLVFELDHIDGNNKNNLRDNLRMLCPNCHSQTDTFRGRNVNSGIKKVSDEDLLNALRNEKSIAVALRSVGLSPRGGNYVRARKLLNK